MVNKLEARILDISMVSSNISFGFIFPDGLFKSRNKHNQYLVSLADFKAISKYLAKSFLEFEALASIILAPMLVKLRINWFNITLLILFSGIELKNLRESKV